MKNIALISYNEQIMRMRRGNYRGHILNAKPIYMLALIDSAVNLADNRIIFDCETVREQYRQSYLFYINNQITPFIKPFYHLSSEPFYQLVWKEEPPGLNKEHTPSAKCLREQLDYAKLDDELWMLLQDKENREYLRQNIITRFL
jgi:putative restriction endonuclease